MDGAEQQYRVKRSDIVYRHMRDPALLRYYYKMKTASAVNKLELQGSSPTDIFIGRFGYPKVSIGPLLPAEFGDTSLMSTPERWWKFSMENIVDMRTRLIRGMHVSNIHDVEKGRIQEQIRDLALAERPAEAEMSFAKKPFIKMELKDHVEPFGPSAQLKTFDVYNIKADKKIESRYTDTDAKASTAIIELYDRGMNVSRIQRALSAGLFGISANRKFVPTRWSITAVDDTLSKYNREEVKGYETIDSIHSYFDVALDNRWLIFFIPGNWQYESLEAFWPGTVWNEDGRNISIFGSYEGYRGRSTYAEMGGCYYSGRLATTEKLKELKKQAMVLILREAHRGYTMPVGVWNVREHVRETLTREPVILHNLQEMFALITKKMSLTPTQWVKNSRLLRELITQRRISEYVA